jgi:hypothetical protein
MLWGYFWVMLIEMIYVFITELNYSFGGKLKCKDNYLIANTEFGALFLLMRYLLMVTPSIINWYVFYKVPSKFGTVVVIL